MLELGGDGRPLLALGATVLLRHTTHLQPAPGDPGRALGRLSGLDP